MILGVDSLSILFNHRSFQNPIAVSPMGTCPLDCFFCPGPSCPVAFSRAHFSTCFLARVPFFRGWLKENLQEMAPQNTLNKLFLSEFPVTQPFDSWPRDFSCCSVLPSQTKWAHRQPSQCLLFIPVGCRNQVFAAIPRLGSRAVTELRTWQTPQGNPV